MTGERPTSDLNREPESIRNDILENQKVIDELNAKLARKTDEVKIIQQISSEINSTLDLDQILEIILNSLDKILSFKHCMVLLADAPEETLRLAASRGYEDPRIGIEVKVGQGVIGMVAKRRRMMRMGNIQSQMAYLSVVRARMEAAGQADQLQEASALPGLSDAQSQLAIPLVVNERLVGVFAVESREANAFDELDELLLSIVANQVASAIDNARLHEDVVERSRQLDTANTELSQLNATLESKVEERTGELAIALDEVNREKDLSENLLNPMAPPAVIPLMLEDKLVAERLQVTVLFSDLQGFTQYSSGIEPDEIFSQLNDYFSAAGEIIQRYRGYVNKTNGDSIMALFGVPFEISTHHTDATLAALAMQNELAGQFPFNIRIGVNSGTITAGMLGPRNKSLYDVIGDAVNVASRMEIICPPGGVTVPSDTAETLAPYFLLESLGEQEIKGKGTMNCLNVVRIRELADDPRRVDNSSRFATEYLLEVSGEVDAVKREHLGMVDFQSVQARDAALRHNEAVASFALALLRLLKSGGASSDDKTGSTDYASIDERRLMTAALVHDIGKRKLDSAQLNKTSPSSQERDTLRRELLASTLETLEHLDLQSLAPLIQDLYRFEETRGVEGEYGPEIEILAASDVYDALVAPKIYKRRPWSIVGALEELLRLPYCRSRKRPVFDAFVALMKPKDATISARSDSQAILR
jgi:adenylate cyclase